MSKITYSDKIGVEPRTVHVNQVWDADMNMVKGVVNENDTCSTSPNYPLLFDKTSAGRRFGSYSNPLTGAITLSTNGGQEGGCAVAIWEGSSNPTINGGVVSNLSGIITQQGVYSIYFHYLNGVFNVIIFNPSGQLPPVAVPDAPTNLAVTGVSDTTIDLSWTKSASGVMVAYRIYIGGAFAGQILADVSSGSITGLSPNTAYNDITVRAYDGLLESEDSNSVNATTSGSGSNPPLAPTLSLSEYSFSVTPEAPTLSLSESSFDVSPLSPSLSLQEITI